MIELQKSQSAVRSKKHEEPRVVRTPELSKIPKSISALSGKNNKETKRVQKPKNLDISSIYGKDSLPEFASLEEFQELPLFQAKRAKAHPGINSRIEIPGSLSPVYRVDSRIYNNVELDDLFDGSQQVIKIFGTEPHNSPENRDPNTDTLRPQEGSFKPRPASYLYSDAEYDLPQAKRNSIESPLKIQLKILPPSKRRQSMMNPVPASLIVDKKFRNSLKRLSANQDQILVQLSKISNFDIQEERDDSQSSGDNSYSQQVSPIKSYQKSNLQLSEFQSVSTHKINQFSLQKCF